MSITPGPWKLETAPGGVNDGWQISSENTSCGKGRYVVLASRGPITGEEFAGNAYLIAAAPEMKDSLKEIVDALERCMFSPFCVHPKLTNRAKALLRRIEGEEEAK